jgi:protoporphyrinogen oxidase
MKIAVLGGGFSGIMLTRLLQEKGHECHLFEAQHALGGLCRSKTIEGFTYDLSGGHMLYSRNPDNLNYILTVTGSENWVKNTAQASIYFNGEYIRYPFEAGLIDLPRDMHYECLMNYINSSYDRKYLHKSEPKNFYDWLIYKFGKGIAYNFMIPFNQKKWNYNLKHINTDWVSSRIPSVPVEEVVKASIGIQTEACKHRLVFYYPQSGGFQDLVSKMALPLENIHLSMPVEDLTRENNQWLINGEYVFDDVISTLALQDLIHIIKNTPPFVTSTLESLWYNGVTTVFLGLKKPFNHEYSWIYLPHKENGPVDTVTCLSNFSSASTPPGYGGLLAEISCRAKSLPEKPEITIEQVTKSLHTCGIIDRNDVIVSDSYFFKYAYPVYGLKFNEFIQIINNYLNELKLKRFGRFATHAYCNVDDIVEQAFRFVEEWY